MAVVEKKFGFNGATETARKEGWAFNAGGASFIAGRADSVASDSPNDAGANPGALVIGRNQEEATNGAPYWEWTGTWEQLGVPAGAKVTAVNLSYDWRNPFAEGILSTYGPAELRDGAGVLRKTFSTQGTFKGQTAWATKAGTNQTGLSDASNTTVKLRLNGCPKTGETFEETCTLYFDWVVITITYEVGGKAFTLTLEDSITLSDALSKGAGCSLSDPLSLSDALGKGGSKSQVDAIALSDQLAKAAERVEAEALPLSDAVAKAAGHSAADALPLNDELAKAAEQVHADNLPLADAIAKSPARIKADALALSDEIGKGVEHVEHDELPLSDSLVKQAGKAIADALALADSLAKRAVGFLADVLGLSDQLTVLRSGQPARLAISDRATTRLVLLDAATTTLVLSDRPATRLAISDRATTNLTLEDGPE